MELKLDKKELTRKLNGLTYSLHYQFKLTAAGSIVLQDEDDRGDDGLEIIDPIATLRNLETATEEQRTYGFPSIAFSDDPDEEDLASEQIGKAMGAGEPDGPSDVKFHPWELLDLGRAPFRFVTIVELPPKSLQEANPFAYENAMRDLPKGIGVGCCAVCGAALQNNYLIEDADGRRFVVGSECVRKVDLPGSADAKLQADVRRAALNREKAKRAKARLEKRVAYEKKMKPVWEKQRLEAEAAEKAAKEERAAKAAGNIEANEWLTSVLAEAMRCYESNFVADFHEKLSEGLARADELSERVTEILREIYGKTVGKTRLGTKKFEAAADEFDAKLEGMK